MTRALIMYSNDPPTPEHIKRLETLSGVKVEVACSESEAVRLAPEAEVFLGHRYLWQTLPVAKSLRWVQSTAAGVDALLVPALHERRPLLTRTPIFSDIIAWHAVALALAVTRDVARASHSAGAGRAPERRVPLGPPRHAVIFGFGSIGNGVGKLLKGMGCRVTGVRPGTGKAEDGCDDLITPDVWLDVLPTADLLVLACPLTDETRGIINAAVLNRLPAHAVLVNVGRGALVDYDALIACLEQGRLGGAASDVIEGITDAQQARLMQFPNVVRTPKVAALCPDRQQRLEAYIESQVKRYVQGDAPLHEVCY